MQDIRVNTFYPTKPHLKQNEVLVALDQGSRFILLRAGRKFRKTSLVISWLIEKALETGLTCPYIAPSKVQAKNIVWGDHIPRILYHFSKQGLTYKTNEVESSISFPKGKLQLFGVENKEALRGISNWGALGADEYDDWEEDIWATIIRPNLMTYKAPAIIGGTPKGFRNLYRFENMRDEQGNLIFKSFHFTSYDNPDLDPQELQAMVTEYKQMGEAYFRQEILAEYERPVGTVYSEWDMERRYIPFNYDPNLPLHLTWDFGVNDPTAIIWIQPHGSELRVVDYYEASNANLEHFVQIINAKPYKTPVLETGDIAGRARTLVTGKSPIDELRRLGHHVRTMPIPDIPSQVRNTHKFIPRLYISKSNPNCERLMQCLVNYRYPDLSTGLRNQENEVPIHDEYSHSMRALEYYCWNLRETSTKLTDNPPSNSFESIIEKARQERLLREEYVGY